MNTKSESMTGDCEKPLAQWILQLCDGDLEQQVEASKHIPRPLHGQPFAPPIPRNPAVEAAFLELGPDARRLIRVLIERLRNANTTKQIGDRSKERFAVWAATGWVVEQIGRLGTMVIPELVSVLHDGDWWNTYIAARVLKELGPDAVPAMAALFEAFERCDKVYLYLVGEALIAIAPFCPKVLPRLIAATASRNPNLRNSAVATLGHMGSPAEDAVPALLRLACDVQNESWTAAIAALMNLEKLDASVFGTLLEATRDRRWYVRREAIRGLGHLSIKPELTVPCVVAALSDEEGFDFTVQQAAIEAVAKFGAQAASAVPKLLELLDAVNAGGDHKDAIDVIHTLEKIGPFAQDALPMLATLLLDQDEYLQIAAREAIAKIKPVSQ